jgi:polyhydroxyalkanoate synthesis regulator phasin
MHRNARSTVKALGIIAGTALAAMAVIGANPANAAHHPRPGGQGGAPAGQAAPVTQSAPTSTTATTPTTASTSTTPGVEPQRGPRPGGGPLGSLVGDGTITVDQARAVREQLRTDARAAREQARTTALTILVGEGALTQAQADAIVAAGRGGLRTLVAAGTLTAEQAHEVQEEFAEYGAVDTSADSLAALVESGVLTQEQADAIGGLLPAPGSRS